VVTNWVTLDSNVESNNPQATTMSSSESMSRQTVEAQGWVVNEKGQVVLTAASPIVTPQGEWLNRAKCHALQNTTIPSLSLIVSQAELDLSPTEHPWVLINLEGIQTYSQVTRDRSCKTRP
jgi:hypothetical protein